MNQRINFDFKKGRFPVKIGKCQDKKCSFAYYRRVVERCLAAAANSLENVPNEQLTDYLWIAYKVLKSELRQENDRAESELNTANKLYDLLVTNKFHGRLHELITATGNGLVRKVEAFTAGVVKGKTWSKQGLHQSNEFQRGLQLLFKDNSIFSQFIGSLGGHNYESGATLEIINSEDPFGLMCGIAGQVFAKRWSSGFFRRFKTPLTRMRDMSKKQISAKELGSALEKQQKASRPLVRKSIREEKGDWVAKASDTSDQLNSLNVFVMGDTKVGKTSIIKRIIHDLFDSDSLTTVGVGFYYQVFAQGNKRVRVKFTDMAGAEKYRDLSLTWCKSNQVFLLVFDAGRIETLETLKAIYNKALKNVKGESIWFLVPHKITTIDENVMAEAAKWARNDHMIRLDPVCAKDGRDNLMKMMSKVLNVAVPKLGL